mmetsp:Transcript_92608/g.271110  ORF Transcript_92608/g.271110 Transcript_92608/m.271110 type:complete len:291 (+) Transcript_92608:240-1112(+)
MCSCCCRRFSMALHACDRTHRPSIWRLCNGRRADHPSLCGSQCVLLSRCSGRWCRESRGGNLCVCSGPNGERCCLPCIDYRRRPGCRCLHGFRSRTGPNRERCRSSCIEDCCRPGCSCLCLLHPHPHSRRRRRGCVQQSTVALHSVGRGGGGGRGGGRLLRGGPWPCRARGSRGRGCQGSLPALLRACGASGGRMPAGRQGGSPGAGPVPHGLPAARPRPRDRRRCPRGGRPSARARQLAWQRCRASLGNHSGGSPQHCPRLLGRQVACQWRGRLFHSPQFKGPAYHVFT